MVGRRGCCRARSDGLVVLPNRIETTCSLAARRARSAKSESFDQITAQCLRLGFDRSVRRCTEAEVIDVIGGIALRRQPRANREAVARRSEGNCIADYPSPGSTTGLSRSPEARGPLHRYDGASGPLSRFRTSNDLVSQVSDPSGEIFDLSDVDFV